MSKNDAIIQLCNLDNNFFEHKIHDSKTDLSAKINRQNWAVNFNSWTDNNVKLTFQGHLIDNEDLLSSPEDSLIELLSHLNISSIDFEMNYNYVEEFIAHNELRPQPPIEISNKEKKIFKRVKVCRYGKGFREVFLILLSINIKKFEEIKTELREYPSSALMVVTKNRDIEDIKKLFDLGHKVFGENRVQEADKKFISQTFLIKFLCI